MVNNNQEKHTTKRHDREYSRSRHGDRRRPRFSQRMTMKIRPSRKLRYRDGGSSSRPLDITRLVERTVSSSPAGTTYSTAPSRKKTASAASTSNPISKSQQLVRKPTEVPDNVPPVTVQSTLTEANPPTVTKQGSPPKDNSSSSKSSQPMVRASVVKEKTIQYYIGGRLIYEKEETVHYNKDIPAAWDLGVDIRDNLFPHD